MDNNQNQPIPQNNSQDSNVPDSASLDGTQITPNISSFPNNEVSQQSQQSQVAETQPPVNQTQATKVPSVEQSLPQQAAGLTQQIPPQPSQVQVGTMPAAANQMPPQPQTVVPQSTIIPAQPLQPEQATADRTLQASTIANNKQPPLVSLVAKLTFRGSDEPQKPKTLLTRIIGIVMIIIAIAGSTANVLAARHIQDARVAIKEFTNPNAAQSEKDKKQAIKDSETEVQDLKDGKLDVSKLFDASIATRPQDITAEYNKQINLSDGVSFAVLESERGWDTGDKYSKPASGKEFILIKLTVGFRGKEGSKYVSNYNFRLVNSKGGLQDTKFVTTSKLTDDELANSSALNPGDTKTGYLIFEVEQGEKVYLVYEDEYSDYERDNGKKFSVKATVEVK